MVCMLHHSSSFLITEKFWFILPWRVRQESVFHFVDSGDVCNASSRLAIGRLQDSANLAKRCESSGQDSRTARSGMLGSGDGCSAQARMRYTFSFFLSFLISSCVRLAIHWDVTYRAPSSAFICLCASCISASERWPVVFLFALAPHAGAWGLGRTYQPDSSPSAPCEHSWHRAERRKSGWPEACSPRPCRWMVGQVN